MSTKYEIDTFKGKINLFKYLICTDKKWCIKSLVVLGIYLIIAFILTLGVMIDLIKYGALSTVLFNLFSNAIILAILLIPTLLVVLYITYAHVGKSLTAINTTVEFNDAERKLIIEYTDLIGKLTLRDADDIIITNTIDYRNIINAGVINRFNCMDIQGYFKKISTDSIRSNNISYARGKKKEVSDNIVLFLSKNNLHTIINKLSTIKEISYFEVNNWFAKEQPSQNQM